MNRELLLSELVMPTTPILTGSAWALHVNGQALFASARLLICKEFIKLILFWHSIKFCVIIEKVNSYI